MAQRRPPNSSLYLRNIPDDARADEIREIFGKYGAVQDIYIPLDYYSRRPRGFAYVQYRDPRDAEDALYTLQDSVKISGTEVSLEWARSDRKTPYEMKTKDRRGGGRSYSRSPRRYRSRSPYYDDRRRSRSPYDDRYRRDREFDRKPRYRSRERYSRERDGAYNRSRSRTMSPRRRSRTASPRLRRRNSPYGGRPRSSSRSPRPQILPDDS